MPRPINRIFFFLFFLLTLGAIGCTGGGGGGFCPFNIPSCCYDTLFGCGTFDLPAGCSCSDYGYMARVNTKNLFPSKPATRSLRVKGDMTGTWSGILNQKSKSCLMFTLKQVNGVASIRDQKRSVFVTIPGYGRLTGRKNGKVTSAMGSYNGKLLCSSSIAVSITSLKDGVAHPHCWRNKP